LNAAPPRTDRRLVHRLRSSAKQSITARMGCLAREASGAALASTSADHLLRGGTPSVASTKAPALAAKGAMLRRSAVSEPPSEDGR